MILRSVVSTAYTIPFTFEDDLYAIVTGKSNSDFSKVAYLASSPATTAVATVAAISGQSGDYGVTFTPSVVGLWRVNVSCVIAGDRTYRWGWLVEVVTAAQYDPVAAFATQGVTMSTPLNAATGTITLVKGDDYLFADSRHLTFDATGYPSLIGGTVEWRAIRDGRTRVTKAGTVVDADSVRVELSDTDTNKLRVGGDYTYEVVAQVGASTLTIATGDLVVTAS